MSITNQDRKQGGKLYERCRAYAIALKVIDESTLSAEQKEDLIGQMFKPILTAYVEVELSDIWQALHRGGDLQSVGAVVKPTRSPEIQWVIDQRQQQEPKGSAASQMTKTVSKEQADVARKADIWACSLTLASNTPRPSSGCGRGKPCAGHPSHDAPCAPKNSGSTMPISAGCARPVEAAAMSSTWCNTPPPAQPNVPSRG